MAGYLVTASVTFSSQTNRDAARTRVNTALSSYAYTNVTTILSPGINSPTTTTMTISIGFDDSDISNASECAAAIQSALVSANRWTSGWVSVGSK